MKALVFVLVLNVGCLCGRTNATSPSTPPLDSDGQTAHDVGGSNTTAESDSRLNDMERLLDGIPQKIQNSTVADKATATPENERPDNERLVEWIEKAHNKDVRPKIHSNYTTHVYHQLGINSILDLNTKTQELVMNVWLEQHWLNPLLRWQPEEFGGLEQIWIPSDKIWLPDVTLHNSVDDYRDDIDYGRYRALCYSHGVNEWSLPTQLRSTCAIDVTYFPFDSQHCHLRFASWMYPASEIDTDAYDVQLNYYVKSREFELITVHKKRHFIDAKQGAPEIVYYIHLRRKPLYYLYTMIIPCLMISLLTLLSFCLPPDSGEKIALGITVLLAFSVFLMAVGDRLPETSDSLPLIGLYLTVVMGMTSISVVMAVAVIRIDNISMTEKRLPEFLRWLILGKIRRLLCMKLSHRRGANRRQVFTDAYLQSIMLQLRSTTASAAEMGPTTPAERFQMAEGEPLDESGGEENEWRKAARVIDRLLFWVLFVATVCVTLTFLVFIPIFARDPAVTDPDMLDDRLYGYRYRPSHG